MPPSQGEAMIYCDGASLGNPSSAGVGVIFRDANILCLSVMCGGIGIATNYMAEVLAILYGLDHARRREWSRVWIISDSQAAVKAFK
ncbi:Ribonuclease H domain [Macleaya cordata]|uniref:Ribonuclease H domain n=1 Tax=Macleaya cordata TaxID=56857 RepID=A0A200QR33_MACCD|nr:Ribonuclease H domain [Macleaya cordata]